MTKRTYLGVMLVFAGTFFLNSFFFQIKLHESYEQVALARIMLQLQAIDAADVNDQETDEALASASLDEFLIDSIARIKSDQRLFYRKTSDGEDFTSTGELTAFVLNTDGEIVSSFHRWDTAPSIPGSVLDKVRENGVDGKPTVQSVEHDDSYYLYRRLGRGEEENGTYFILRLDPDILNPWIDGRLKAHEDNMLTTGAWGGLLALALTLITVRRCSSPKRIAYKIYLATAVAISFPLLVSLFLNITLFQDSYVSLARQNAIDLASRLVSYPDTRPIPGGPSISTTSEGAGPVIYPGLSSQFASIARYPAGQRDPVMPVHETEIESISLDNYLIGRLRREDMILIVPLTDYRKDRMGENRVIVQLSVDDILDKTWSLIVNGLTLFMVALLLLVELLYLLISIIARGTQQVKDSNQTLVRYMRPAIYFFLLGIDISMAFVPLHTQNLYSPEYGFSEDLIMGLPISVEFLFVGIFILISGIWVDRRGWHEPFLIGLALAAAGAFYSWLAPDAIQFILSRALIGTGYGLTLMAAQGFIVKFSGPDGKATGLANLIAGLYAGSICGAVIGSIMAEAYGYRPVFMFGGIILLAVVIYTFLLLHEAMVRPVAIEAKKSKGAWSGRNLFRFLFDLDVVALSLFSSMPASIAIVGFLNYFTPIYLDNMSTPESTIGQVLMIYGFSLIFMGPLIGRYIDRSSNKKSYVVFGGLLGAAAFLTFDSSAGVSAAVLAIILLGISSSFVLSSQSTMILNLRVTKELGEAKALGIFRSISRIGQVVGPIVFGGIFLASDIDQVMTYFGAAYLIAVALLLVLVRERRRELPIAGEYQES